MNILRNCFYRNTDDFPYSIGEYILFNSFLYEKIYVARKMSLEKLVLSLRLDGDITFSLDDSPKAFGSIAVYCDGRMIGRMSRKDAEKHVLRCGKNGRCRYVARLSRVDYKNLYVRIGIYEKVDWNEYIFVGKFPLHDVCLSLDDHDSIKEGSLLSVIEDRYQSDEENDEMENRLMIFDNQNRYLGTITAKQYVPDDELDGHHMLAKPVSWNPHGEKIIVGVYIERRHRRHDQIQ